MTREQAIAIIRQECLCVDRDCNIEKNCGNCDLAMPSKEPILEAYKMAIKALEQEPCEDCVSREEAILVMCRNCADWQTCKLNCIKVQAMRNIEKLPSVQPKQRTGYISIDDVMSVFDDFMCGEVDEDGTDTFLEMLKDKAEGSDKE